MGQRETRTYNLFENVTQGAYIKNCKNFEALFNKNEIIQNITIINSENITLGAC